MLFLDEKLRQPVVRPLHDLVKSTQILETFAKVTDEDEAFFDAIDKRLAKFGEVRKITENEAATAATTRKNQSKRNNWVVDDAEYLPDSWQCMPPSVPASRS